MAGDHGKYTAKAKKRMKKGSVYNYAAAHRFSDPHLPLLIPSQAQVAGSYISYRICS